MWSVELCTPKSGFVGTGAGRVLAQTASEFLLNSVRNQIVPIGLAKEPEFAALLASIDTARLDPDQ